MKQGDDTASAISRKLVDRAIAAYRRAAAPAANYWLHVDAMHAALTEVAPEIARHERQRADNAEATIVANMVVRGQLEARIAALEARLATIEPPEYRGMDLADRDVCEVCGVCLMPEPPPRCEDHVHTERGDPEWTHEPDCP